jgi:hypothetical protein
MGRETRSITTRFDFSLGRPMTPRLARAIYGLALAVLAILAVTAVVYGAMLSPALGVLIIAVAGAGVLLGAVLLRLWLGALLAVTRLEERTEEIAEQVAGIALNTAPIAEPGRREHVESPPN